MKQSPNINPIALYRLRQIPASYLATPRTCMFAQSANRTKMFHVKHFGTIGDSFRTIRVTDVSGVIAGLLVKDGRFAQF